MTRKERELRAPILLVGGFALFLVAIVVLVGSSLVKREVPTYSPTATDPARPTLRPGEVDTLTVDATASDRWQRVALERGTVVGASADAGWDLAVRRHHVIAGDAITDLGPVSFGSVSHAPAGGYVANRVGTDTTNDAIERWYSYSLWSHLLTPRGHVYVLRTPGGRYAKLEVLSYYCPGLRAGCMTFRYAFLPSGRS